MKRRAPNTTIYKKPYILRWGSKKFKVVAAHKPVRFDWDDVSLDQDDFVNGRLMNFSGRFRLEDICHIVFLSRKFRLNVIAPNIGGLKRPPGSIQSSQSAPAKDPHAIILVDRKKMPASVWVEDLTPEDVQLVRSIKSKSSPPSSRGTSISDDYTRIEWANNVVSLPVTAYNPRRFLCFLIRYLAENRTSMFSFEQVRKLFNSASRQQKIPYPLIQSNKFRSYLFKNYGTQWDQLFKKMPGRSSYRLIPPLPAYIPPLLDV